MTLVSIETIIPILVSIFCILFTAYVNHKANRGLEKIKSTIENENKNIEKRRDAYERIANSLRVFTSGHESSREVKNNFYTAYSMAWLWVPEPVLIALNNFLDQQIISTNTKQFNQDLSKKLFEAIILEMRLDLGFPVSENIKYQFVSFH
ncbi:hypothetical protein [Paremcibacter congregatus]|uniref:hypothetical protein n=1 Tax=Paremcibacter congregatus TaxID=2043170 RepID=UPI003A931989